MTGKLRLWLALAMWMIAASIRGQERCGFDLRQQLHGGETPKDFERWISERLQQRYMLQTTKTQATITIPVVVHVIHNGPNSPSFIPKAQVLSQIKVLNNDFQRLNADRTQTPAVWQPIAAAMDVEFVLAKRDPLGLPTDGIVYTRGTKSSYDLLTGRSAVQSAELLARGAVPQCLGSAHAGHLQPYWFGFLPTIFTSGFRRSEPEPVNRWRLARSQSVWLN